MRLIKKRWKRIYVEHANQWRFLPIFYGVDVALPFIVIVMNKHPLAFVIPLDGFVVVVRMVLYQSKESSEECHRALVRSIVFSQQRIDLIL